MKVGWTYRIPGDKTLKDLKLEESPYLEENLEDVMPDVGALKYLPEKEGYGEGYIVDLYFCTEIEQMRQMPLKKGQAGTWSVKPSGKKIWCMNDNLKLRIKYNSLDEEIIEANPFPIFKQIPDYEIIYLPDPWLWETVPVIEPHSKESDYVSTWTIKDVITLGITGIVSLPLIMSGGDALTILTMLWLGVLSYIFGKHRRIKTQILEERKRLGIRGDGLDHTFRYDK